MEEIWCSEGQSGSSEQQIWCSEGQFSSSEEQIRAQRGSIYETVSNLYFLFERIYTCLLGYLFLYSKGGGGTEPLVYPCDTKVNILLLRAFIISVMLLSVVQT